LWPSAPAAGAAPSAMLRLFTASVTSSMAREQRNWVLRGLGGGSSSSRVAGRDFGGDGGGKMGYRGLGFYTG
jgi:hypothetical protein